MTLINGEKYHQLRGLVKHPVAQLVVQVSVILGIPAAATFGTILGLQILSKIDKSADAVSVVQNRLDLMDYRMTGIEGAVRDVGARVARVEGLFFKPVAPISYEVPERP